MVTHMKQVFFGTPHKGANVATWGRQISNIAQAILHRPPANFLKILERHSPDLLKVSEDFRPYAMRYAITSFYEQHAMKGLGSVVSLLRIVSFFHASQSWCAAYWRLGRDWHSTDVCFL